MTKKFKTRLRPDAIPTIFVHRPVVKKRRAPAPRCTLRPSQHAASQSAASQHSSEPSASYLGLLKKLKRQEKISKNAKAALRKIKNENAALKKRIKIRDNILKKFLSKDQIMALGRRTTKGMKWSNETIKKALKIRFASGPTGYKTLQELQIPLPAIRTLERECVLSLDEMAITPSVELHMLTGKLYGDVTLPGHTGVATHACVFMLAGNTTRWKQVVAYHYSGNSTNGAEYKPIITELIERAASIGLHVLAVTTDMGSPNQAMWKSFGVDHTKTSVPHPTTPDRCLHFMPDVPHLVKNLKSTLVRGQVLTIPENVVNKENLPSNEVSVVPIKDLLSFQEGMALKVAPHLSAAAIEPSHFEKMKVGPALNVFSKATSAGLKYMVQQENRPLSYLTTAWFLEQVDHWFDLMSSRHPITALSRVKIEEYEKAIIFLQDIIHLFYGIKIGHKGVWKPTPVEFHHALRIISVGQFFSTITSGSYQEDDSSFLADFLTKTEKCILFHLAGYIVHKLIRFASICGKCKTATRQTDDNPAGNNSILLNLKEFKAGALCRPSQEAYDFTQQIEKLFRSKSSFYLMELPNAVDVLEKEAQSLSSRLPSCCGVEGKISKRFIRLRLRIEAFVFILTMVPSVLLTCIITDAPSQNSPVVKNH